MSLYPYPTLSVLVCVEGGVGEVGAFSGAFVSRLEKKEVEEGSIAQVGRGGAGGAQGSRTDVLS